MGNLTQKTTNFFLKKKQQNKPSVPKQVESQTHEHCGGTTLAIRGIAEWEARKNSLG